MMGMRKWVGFLMALAFAVFALPGIAAPAKIFGLVMAPSTVTTATGPLTATFSNLTPNGNSVINTVILTPPSGVSATATFLQGGNQVQCPLTTQNSSGQTVPVPANSICVANIPSVMKAGCTPVACSWTMNVTATLPNACSVNTWAGQAFAGNSFNGDVFAFQAGFSSVTTTISTQCPITITTAANPAAGGSVTCTPNPVPYNGSSTCTASANTFYTFTGFTGDCTGATCTFTGVTSSKTVTANFVANALSITSTPSSAALGTPFFVTVNATNGPVSVSVAAGCDATVTPTPPISSPATFSITINSMPATTQCTITFSALNYPDYKLANLQVYKGVLGCGDYDSINGPLDPFYNPDKTSGEFVGFPGWGLVRGPNRDGALPCVKVNYTCDLDTAQDPAIATCTWDKNVVPAQQATFKYLFLWPAKAPANGWKDYHPQVSWNITNPSAPPPSLPDWVPLLACLNDIFPTLPVLPTTILPTIPFVSPFTDSANLLVNGGHAWYQPGQTALVCGGQQGWTAVGGPGNPLLQFWSIIIDEADLKVSGP